MGAGNDLRYGNNLAESPEILIDDDVDGYDAIAFDVGQADGHSAVAGSDIENAKRSSTVFRLEVSRQLHALLKALANEIDVVLIVPLAWRDAARQAGDGEVLILRAEMFPLDAHYRAPYCRR